MDAMHENKYRKVASSRLSWLLALLRIFRLFMKGKFDAYLLDLVFLSVSVISSIFDKCPDRVITSNSAKPYILQKTLFD